MKRGIIITVSVLFLLLGGVLVVPGLVDWNKYKEPIVAQIESLTGYEVAIAGDLHMTVLPFPQVIINGLSVTVPGEAEPLVALKSAAVNVALMPLLKKQLQMNSVELKNPDVRLVVDAQGQPLWMTPTLKQRLESGAQKPAAGSEALTISLDSLRVTEGNFIFDDRRSKKNFALSAINTTISAQSLAGPFTMAGNARYGTALTRVDLKTARIDANAATPVQADIVFPELATELHYKGIAGMKEGAIDLQGETAFKSGDLSAWLAATTGKANPAVAKAVDAQGLLTLSANAVALRNMQLSFGGQKFTGAIDVADIKARPMVAGLTLAAVQPVDIRALIPPAAARKQPQKAFLPETLALPADINGKIDLKLAGVRFDKIEGQNVALSAEKADGRIAWKMGADMAGGKASGEGTVAFASVTRTPAGGVTYTEPQAQVKASVQNIDIEDTLKTFATAEQMKAVAPILSDALSGNFDVAITPRAIRAAPAVLKVGKEEVTYSAAYSLGARPLLDLAIGMESVDAGRWIQPPQQAGQAAAAAPAATAGKAKIAELAKKFTLPLDLKLTLALKNASMPGARYDEVFFVGKVTGDRLDIEKAGLRDAQQNNVSIAGAVGSVKELRDIDLTIAGATPDADKMLASFNVDTKKLPKNIGRAELTSEFKGQADNLSFVVNLKAMQGSMESSGKLTNLLATPQVGGLNVRLRHPSYVDVMRIFNPAFNSGVTMRKSLDLFASMQRTGDVYEFTDMQAMVGDVKAGGNLSVNMAGTRPSAKGVLQFGNVPVDELLGMQTAAKGTVRAVTNTPSATPGDVRWSRNAINTAWMWKFDLDLAATAGAVSYGQWRVDEADIALSLKDGTLTISRLNGKIGGGTMGMTGSMKSSDKERQPVLVAASAKFTGVELEQLVRGFSGSRLVRARGPVSMNLDVSSTGISPAALIFDLKGAGKAEGKNLVFEGFDLARLSRTLAAPSSSGTENISNLLNATMSGGSTTFDTFYTDIAITEGVAGFPKFKLDNKDAVVGMEGTVNLPLWTVDMTSVIQIKEPANVPPLRVAFKGPLDNPGQTFGKAAMEGYLQQMIGNRVQEAIGKKVDEALGGKLPQFLGGTAPVAPSPAPSAAPVGPVDAAPVPPPVEAAPAPEPAPQTQAAPPAEPTPEQQLMGIMNNLIQGN